jgi:hypothetical protein
LLHKLFFVAVSMISISTDARAALVVEQAEYRAGTLVVRGKTAMAHQTITLDGLYRAQSDSSGEFQFLIHYLPHNCAVRLRSGADIVHAAVAKCRPH